MNSLDIETRLVVGRGSGILVVVFSQVRVPAGHFGLSRLFARLRHGCLFVNQPSGRWYRDSEAAVDAAIEAAMAATVPRRVVFYGSSMGGWGALQAGSRWPDAEVIAFAPDHRIGEAGSRSEEAGLAIGSGELGLIDLLESRSRAPTTIVSGLFDPYDAGVHARIADLPNVRAVPVRSAHAVHDHLYTVNVIRRITATFERDVTEAIAARDLVHPPVDRSRLVAFARMAERLRSGQAIDPADIRALELDGNPGAGLLEAESLERSGDLAAAEARLARVWDEIEASATLRTLPKRTQKVIPLRRMELLARLRRDDEASAVAVAAARLLSD